MYKHDFSASSQVLMPMNDGSSNIFSLNGIWKFKYLPSVFTSRDSLFFMSAFDTDKWANIVTPGCWELQGFAEPKYAGELKEGAGLYRTSFEIPANWKNQQVYIGFDGVCYGYDFWVNGSYAGSFASSFNRQTFDITKFIQTGKPNTLAVKVSTRAKGWAFDTNDDWSLSGIIRDVNVFALPVTHIKDIIVTTKVKNEKSAHVSFNVIIEK